MVVVHPHGRVPPEGPASADHGAPGLLVHPATRLPLAIVLAVASILILLTSASRAPIATVSHGIVTVALPPLAQDRSPAAPITALNLNAATEQQLLLLPRIGPSLARRIVADRERHGPYRTVNQLDRVVGIGPKTIERLRPFVTVEQ